MASDGEIAFLPTNSRSIDDAIRLKVYRESTTNRTATLKVTVSADAIASQHVYLHARYGCPVHYEICHPEILRVGLVPGAVLSLAGDFALPVANDLKRFNYVVLGDADTSDGLTAPYDEEDTQQLFLLERCDGETIFDFWKRNANSDLHDGRDVERMTFETP